jgi:hypothetical protein
MEEAGFSKVTIKHGSGNLVTHWAVETANLFVIADGVQSISEMQHTTDRFGIAFGWRTLQGGRQQSQIRFRAFLQELLEFGFTEPLLVTAKGTLTGDIINALTRQYEVLDAVDAIRKQQGKPPMNPPFYACSIPLGPGQDVTRGTGGQTKEITPIVARIPTQITKDYVLAHWIKKPLVAMIESMMDQTVSWSVSTSTLISSGEDAAGVTPAEEEPVAVVAPLPRQVPQRAAPVTANGHGPSRRRNDDDLL